MSSFPTGEEYEPLVWHYLVQQISTSSNLTYERSGNEESERNLSFDQQISVVFDEVTLEKHCSLSDHALIEICFTFVIVTTS